MPGPYSRANQFVITSRGRVGPAPTSFTCSGPPHPRSRPAEPDRRPDAIEEREVALPRTGVPDNHRRAHRLDPGGARHRREEPEIGRQAAAQRPPFGAAAAGEEPASTLELRCHVG